MKSIQLDMKWKIILVLAISLLLGHFLNTHTYQTPSNVPVVSTLKPPPKVTTLPPGLLKTPQTDKVTPAVIRTPNLTANKTATNLTVKTTTKPKKSK